MEIDENLDLVLERVVDVSPQAIWKAWTTPTSMMKWFCPRPWKTIECEMDLRPGGIFRTVMESPEGERFPNMGCILEVIENKKLVWTDALLPGYRPVVRAESGAGMLFTGFIILEPHGMGTKYIAIARHKDQQDCKTHFDMGFHQGWGVVLDQLLEEIKCQ